MMAHAHKHNLSSEDHPDVDISGPVNGDTLVYDSSTSKWENRMQAYPRCSVYSSVDILTNTGTWKTLDFDSELYDKGNMHDTVTNKSRVTIPTGESGLYLILAQICFESNATGYRQGQITKNGTTLIMTFEKPAPAPGHTMLQLYQVIELAAGDYLEMKGYQNSGADVYIKSGSTRTFLTVVRIN